MINADKGDRARQGMVWAGHAIERIDLIMGFEPSSTVGEEINGPGRAYFENVVFDNILDALTELAAEVWVCRDRQYVLERVLARHGVDAAAEVEAHVWTAEEISARKALRERFVDQVFAGFVRRPE